MSAAVAERPVNPIVVMEQQLESRLPEFAKALPAHIPAERFKRVVLTAIQNNPGLLKVERRSFFTACMRAAQDGLLPDGREGAIVEYNDRQRGPIAQWMPMVAGLRKKVRNSGEIADWNAYVVFANDEFAFELGDNPYIRHKPALDDRGKPIAAYSVARFKTGEISREVMSISEIEKVRSVSRAKDSERGPWKQWFEEMARKTVARRHAKVLPMSTDLDDLIRRDDDLYDMKGAREEAATENRRPGLTAMLDQLAERPGVVIDSETGEITADADAAGETSERDDATARASQEAERGAVPVGEVDRDPAAGSASDPATAPPAAAASDEGGPMQDAEDPDSSHARLVAHLRTKAQSGARALKLALGKLSEGEQGLLTDADRKQLSAIAENPAG